MSLLALLLPLVSLAFAGKVERVSELAAAGSDAEVVETVTRWEEQGALGDDAAALILLRDRAALNLATAAHSSKALATFRARYPNSTLLPDALQAEADLAFDEAQDEGTSAALRAFLAAYPATPWRARALALEDGLAFQEAIGAGTREALDEFRRYHPSSPYLATAWEAVAAHTPGIHLLQADGSPYQLPAVGIAGDRVTLERSPARSSPRLTVAVNLPGTGRGGTSEWWGLSALGSDGSFLQTSPVGEALADALGVAAPSMLDLAPASGAHSARVATTLEPLVSPGTCEGVANFAFVLRTTEGTRTAFPFAVDCALDDAGVKAAAGFAGPALVDAIAMAERGDLAGATAAWKHALTLPDGPRLAEWLEAQANGAAPVDRWITLRAAVGDVLEWTPSPTGGTTAWLHTTAGGTVELAKRDGLWIADGARLWTLSTAPEPWTAKASGKCAAASGERTALALVDVLGTDRVDVPFPSERGGSVTVVGFGPAGLVVADDGVSPGCPRPSPAGLRTVPLPGSTPVAPEAAPAPAAPPATPLAPGPVRSTIGANPRAAYAAFTGPAN